MVLIVMVDYLLHWITHHAFLGKSFYTQLPRAQHSRRPHKKKHAIFFFSVNCTASIPISSSSALPSLPSNFPEARLRGYFNWAMVADGQLEKPLEKPIHQSTTSGKWRKKKKNMIEMYK